jgi:hypothetical protein
MKVSSNRRYLVDDYGKPFFYLADTSWALFYNISKEEAECYLRNRWEKGFTVVMPVVLRRKDTLARKVREEMPLVNWDPARPNEAFFRHVDDVIDAAGEMGLYVALLPTWGELVGPGTEPTVFTVENAQTFGVFLGQRYRDKPVFWVLGGDRNPTSERAVAIWRAMVHGLKTGDGGKHLMTFHPQAPFSSSKWWHDEPWLDFNMIQTSTRLKEKNHFHILADYNRTPVKPTLDGETRYENSHEVFSPRLMETGATPTGEKIKPYHVRKAAYTCMLSGALGHTYGCRDVWSFYVPSEHKPGLDVDTWWKRAMDFLGAHQMGFLKKLFLDYPWYELVPDQEETVIAGGRFVHPRLRHIPAALSEDRRFALVYVPYDMRVCIDTGVLAGERISAKWFNPRDGAYLFIGEYTDAGIQGFRTPGDDADPDYVLVLEAL